MPTPEVVDASPDELVRRIERLVKHTDAKYRMLRATAKTCQRAVTEHVVSQPVPVPAAAEGGAPAAAPADAAAATKEVTPLEQITLVASLSLLALDVIDQSISKKAIDATIQLAEWLVNTGYIPRNLRHPSALPWVYVAEAAPKKGFASKLFGGDAGPDPQQGATVWAPGAPFAGTFVQLLRTKAFPIVRKSLNPESIKDLFTMAVSVADSGTMVDETRGVLIPNKEPVLGIPDDTIVEVVGLALDLFRVGLTAGCVDKAATWHTSLSKAFSLVSSTTERDATGAFGDVVARVIQLLSKSTNPAVTDNAAAAASTSHSAADFTFEVDVLQLSLLLQLVVNGGPRFRDHARICEATKSATFPYMIKMALADDHDSNRLALSLFFAIFTRMGETGAFTVELEAFFVSVVFEVLDAKTAATRQRSLVGDLLLQISEEASNLIKLFLNYDCDSRRQTIYEGLLRRQASTAGGSIEPLSFADVTAKGDDAFEVVSKLAAANPSKGSTLVSDEIQAKAQLFLQRLVEANHEWVERFRVDVEAALEASHATPTPRDLVRNNTTPAAEGTADVNATSVNSEAPELTRTSGSSILEQSLPNSESSLRRVRGAHERTVSTDVASAEAVRAQHRAKKTLQHGLFTFNKRHDPIGAINYLIENGIIKEGMPSRIPVADTLKSVQAAVAQSAAALVTNLAAEAPSCEGSAERDGDPLDLTADESGNEEPEPQLQEIIIAAANMTAAEAEPAADGHLEVTDSPRSCASRDTADHPVMTPVRDGEDEEDGSMGLAANTGDVTAEGTDDPTIIEHPSAVYDDEEDTTAGFEEESTSKSRVEEEEEAAEVAEEVPVAAAQQLEEVDAAAEDQQLGDGDEQEPSAPESPIAAPSDDGTRSPEREPTPEPIALDSPPAEEEPQSEPPTIPEPEEEDADEATEDDTAVATVEPEAEPVAEPAPVPPPATAAPAEAPSVMEQMAVSVARFLRQYETALNKVVLGEFFAKAIKKPDVCAVFEAWIDEHDFSGMLLDEALRLFLGGFKVVGEAQQVEKAVELFSEKYASQNPDGPLDATNAFVLSFSICMLNTDAHSAQVKDKMTKEQFLSNNRTIEAPKEMLEGIYDRVKECEIVLRKGHADEVSVEVAPESASLLSTIPILRSIIPVASAVVMAPVDFAGNAIFDTDRKKMNAARREEFHRILESAMDGLRATIDAPSDFLPATRVEHAIPMWGFTADAAISSFFAALDVETQDVKEIDRIVNTLVTAYDVCASYGDNDHALVIIAMLLGRVDDVEASVVTAKGQRIVLGALEMLAMDAIVVPTTIWKHVLQLALDLIGLGGPSAPRAVSNTSLGNKQHSEGASTAEGDASAEKPRSGGRQRSQSQRKSGGWFSSSEVAVSPTEAAAAFVAPGGPFSTLMDRIFDATSMSPTTQPAVLLACLEAIASSPTIIATDSIQRVAGLLRTSFDVLPRVTWRELWPQVGAAFVRLSEARPEGAAAVVDAVRTVVLVFLRKEHSLRFEEEMLQPFEQLYVSASQQRKAILLALKEIAELRGSQLYHGWVVVLRVMGYLATEPEFANAAWDSVSKAIRVHGTTIPCWGTAITSVASFAASGSTDVALSALETLRRCGTWVLAADDEQPSLASTVRESSLSRSPQVGDHSSPPPSPQSGLMRRTSLYNLPVRTPETQWRALVNARSAFLPLIISHSDPSIKDAALSQFFAMVRETFPLERRTDWANICSDVISTLRALLAGPLSADVVVALTITAVHRTLDLMIGGYFGVADVCKILATICAYGYRRPGAVAAAAALICSCCAPSRFRGDCAECCLDAAPPLHLTDEESAQLSRELADDSEETSRRNELLTLPELSHAFEVIATSSHDAGNDVGDDTVRLLSCLTFLAGAMAVTQPVPKDDAAIPSQIDVDAVNARKAWRALQDDFVSTAGGMASASLQGAEHRVSRIAARLATRAATVSTVVDCGDSATVLSLFEDVVNTMTGTYAVAVQRCTAASGQAGVPPSFSQVFLDEASDEVDSVGEEYVATLLCTQYALKRFLAARIRIPPEAVARALRCVPSSLEEAAAERWLESVRVAASIDRGTGIVEPIVSLLGATLIAGAPLRE